MPGNFHAQMLHEAAEILRGLMEIGINLSALADRRRMFEMILREARTVAHAEAGSLYVLKRDKLRLAASQNDRPGPASPWPPDFDSDSPHSARSLAAHVAASGLVVSLPGSATVPADAPYSLGSDLDAVGVAEAAGVLGIPLARPDGRCIGVLVLVNHVGADGRAGPFPPTSTSGILPLAAMAAATIHAGLVQDELRTSHLDTIIRLSLLVEHRDMATADHLRRVSHTAGLVACALGLTDRQVELIECAAPMHDIGKVGIPESILLKADALTPEERQTMEQHTTLGADLLGQPSNDLLAVAREVILSHHERWDGSGYPAGLMGKAIPVCGRIVGLADAFDALLSQRNHREAYSLAKVLITIRTERGRQFDPDVVDAFFRVLAPILEPYGLANPTAVLSGTAG